jgi:hypothetical protein
MNDFRGFSRSPLSISGFSYSDDGGITFIDGGQLPVTVPTSVFLGQTYPQVFGDPEVKYLGGSTFAYSLRIHCEIAFQHPISADATAILDLDAGSISCGRLCADAGSTP